VVSPSPESLKLISEGVESTDVATPGAKSVSSLPDSHVRAVLSFCIAVLPAQCQAYALGAQVLHFCNRTAVLYGETALHESVW
jgi:hypothetical protein